MKKDKESEIKAGQREAEEFATIYNCTRLQDEKAELVIIHIGETSTAAIRTRANCPEHWSMDLISNPLPAPMLGNYLRTMRLSGRLEYLVNDFIQTMKRRKVI